MRSIIVMTLLLIGASSISAVVPSDIGGNGELYTQEQWIIEYFHSGFTYREIIFLMFVMRGIKVSLRRLKTVLRENNLKRRMQHTPENIVIDTILGELQNSGQCVGYRTMWRRLVKDHNLSIPRDHVLRLMRNLDPDGVNLRKAHRLQRRKYYARGSNYVWHVDGYDKLKPFGFCIHGAIDGYSRRILWLEVSSSNNDPSIIAMYFLETLKHLHVAPRLLRCDRGTENSTLAVLQPFFRFHDTDRLAGLNSFAYGRSVSNQRIESWWGILRRSGVHWWICFFKDLRDSNLFDETNALHVEFLKYCFMDIIQAELDRVAQNWNLHTIRSQKNADIPSGKPDLMYFCPEVFGGQDYGHPVDINDVDICIELYGSRKKLYSAEVEELANLLLPLHHKPIHVDAAVELYNALLRLYEDFA